MKTKKEYIIIDMLLFEAIQYCNGDEPTQRITDYYMDKLGKLPHREVLKVILVDRLNNIQKEHNE